MLVAALAVATPLAPAAAQEADCVALSPDGFRALTEDAFDALFADDAGRVERVLQALRAQVRCLAGPVPTSSWARLLYGQALVAYARGEAWEPLVTAALRADPDLVRDLGPPVVRGYEPPAGAQAHTLPPRTDGRVVLLDGVVVTGPFDLVGPHILQLAPADGDVPWESRWVDDGVVPDRFRVSEAPSTSGPDPAASSGATASPALAVRLHAGVGVHLSTGPEVVTAEATQAGVRVSLPIEVGVAIEPGAGWVRAVGSFVPQLTGPWVYTVDGDVRSSALAGGAHLAGGGRLGRGRVGHVGALAGLHVPGRLTFQAVGGGTVWTKGGLRIEGRAGIHLTTAMRVEPAIDVAFVFSPALWTSAGRE